MRRPRRSRAAYGYERWCFGNPPVVDMASSHGGPHFWADQTWCPLWWWNCLGWCHISWPLYVTLLGTNIFPLPAALLSRWFPFPVCWDMLYGSPEGNDQLIWQNIPIIHRGFSSHVRVLAGFLYDIQLYDIRRMLMLQLGRLWQWKSWPWRKLTWAMKKRAPGWLGYIGDEILHSYIGDYNKPL